MGCDIHMFAEKLEDKQWVTADDWSKDYFILHGCDDRNYALFAVLADVRNYHNITPIASPKGIPDQVSEEVWYVFKEWGSDAHSPSYLSLRELQEYVDSLKTIKVTCLLTQSSDWLKWAEPPLIDIINILKQIHNEPDKVRIVFWFDN